MTKRGVTEIPFERAIALAKYYSVSLDYIAGLTNDKRGLYADKPASALGPQQSEAVEKFVSAVVSSGDRLQKERLSAVVSELLLLL